MTLCVLNAKLFLAYFGGVILNKLIKKELKIPIEYVGFISKYSNGSKVTVRHNVKNFVEFISGGGFNLDTLNQSLINIYCDRLRNKLGNASYNQNVSNIKNFLNYMGKNGFEYKFEKVEPYGTIKIISLRAFRNIIDYLSNAMNKPSRKRKKHLRDYILFLLMFLTALRKTEILTLKHNSIVKEAGKYFYTVKIKGGTVKKKEFPFFLVELVGKLKKTEHKNSNSYIFTSPRTKENKTLSNKALNKVINFYNKKINGATENITVHSIRALSAFNLHSSRNNILEVQEHLNHKNLNTTQIYLSKLQTKDIKYYDDLLGMINL